MNSTSADGPHPLNPYWRNSKIFRSVLRGLTGAGLHVKSEADVESIKTVAQALAPIAERFCKRHERI